MTEKQIRKALKDSRALCTEINTLEGLLRAPNLKARPSMRPGKVEIAGHALSPERAKKLISTFVEVLTEEELEG